MPDKKNNHFVGKGIIKFWADENGQVAYWEKNAAGKIELRNPKSVHKFDYLYASWDVSGKRDMRAEDALAVEIDNHAPDHVLKMLSEYPKVIPMSAERRDFLARMVVRTIIRNPAVLDHVSRTPLGRLVQFLYRLKRRLERGRSPDSAYEKRGRDRVLLGEMISNLVEIDIEERVKELSAKRFALLVPESEAPNFVLGSQPYFINPHMRNSSTDFGRMNDAFCGIVIHPRMLLAIFDDGDEDEILFANRDDMQRINGLFIKYSSSVVSVTPADLEGAWYHPFGKEDSDDIHRVSITAAL